MKRLLTYLKPHKWMMLLASVLVVALIGVELYKPIIIGNAIDHYIGSYGQAGMDLEGTYYGILGAGVLYAVGIENIKDLIGELETLFKA